MPLTEYDATRTRRQPKVPRGLDAVSHWIRGALQRRRVGFADLKAEANRIHQLAESLHGLASARFDEKLVATHRKARLGYRKGVDREGRRQILAALAAAMRRATGLSPYPEQILGALVMQQGCLAEMATGEGKTLTIGLTAAFLAWSGRPCHVITANDYLVERDAATLEKFYQLCGLNVGTVTATHLPSSRREGYAADITYVTSKEVVADFLRDRLALQDWAHPTRRLIQRFLRPHRNPLDQTVTRGLHAAIIDEADHILIDEAVTPLIISRPVDNVDLENACRRACQLAAELDLSSDYDRFPRYRDIHLTSRGKKRLKFIVPELPAMWRNPNRAEELLRQALVAREFFKRGEQYVLTDKNKIAIIDESTGRLTPERTWRQGLHQAIEAKEGLPLTTPSETLSRLSFQRFFRFYRHLSGCSGTAREAASELWHIYRLPTFSVAPHRPCLRKKLPSQWFGDAESKRQAIVAKVAAAHRKRQPILVGTRSVSESETLFEMFEKAGLPAHLLNAERLRHEANIIADAGHHSTITIATNMAGRGTDIKLANGVEELGGLLVIISEMHASARIDRQLAGRSARQGEAGEVQLFASFEDNLAIRFLHPWQRHIGRTLLTLRLPFSRPLAARLLRHAQKRAAAQSRRERKQVPRQDEWLTESLAFAGKDLGA